MFYNKNVTYKQLADAIRILSMDAVEKAKSGHPGMPLGMADVATILFSKYLKYNSQQPKWFNRDRFILSAGHGSMLLYSLLHLNGYADFPLETIKNFRKLKSKAAGHPENFLSEAIETTTGPLGQGVANAVGMAIAQKKYQTLLNNNICDYKIYCLAGDGCLMEGVAYEALSLAGHLKLNNLIILFDSNNITIDGKTDLTISEDQLAKFTALGFTCLEADAHNFEDIDNIFNKAQSVDKPVIIKFNSKIGFGSVNKVDVSAAHGAPLGADEIKLTKQNLAVDEEDFSISPEILAAWQEIANSKRDNYNNWQKQAAELTNSQQKYLDNSWADINLSKLLDNYEPDNKALASRVANGKIIEYLLTQSEAFIVGSADLAGSNNLNNQNVKLISATDFSGNFINYGIREHAMAAIMNGIALSGFKPLGGSFLIFSDYMRPAMRLSALMQQQVFYIMTHDSIGLGEDGPTHQPIEHLTSFRAMPNINVFRPAAEIEVLYSWQAALKHLKSPAIFALSRQKIKDFSQYANLVNYENLKNNCHKGGYVLAESAKKPEITIFSSGSEVELALEAKQQLADYDIQVVSVPCLDLLMQQDEIYLNKLVNDNSLKIVIEAANCDSWYKLLGNCKVIAMDSFGASAPATDLYQHFDITVEHIINIIKENIKK